MSTPYRQRSKYLVHSDQPARVDPIHLSTQRPDSISSQSAASTVPPIPRALCSIVGLSEIRKFYSNNAITEQIRGLATERFAAAELAWLVAGIHKDGDHEVPMNTFHRMHTNILKEMPGREERGRWRDSLKDLLFDAVSHPSSVVYIFY